MRKKNTMINRFISSEFVCRNKWLFIKNNSLFSFKLLIFNSNEVYGVDNKELNLIERMKNLFSTKYNNLANKIVSIVHFYSFESKIKPIIFNTL